jgi:hypothetical protein
LAALPLTTWLAIAEALAKVPKQGKSDGNPAADEYSFNTNEIGRFTVGEKQYSLFASLRNDPTKPSLWAFAYSPLLLPQADKDGQPDFVIEPIDSSKTGAYRVALTIWLSSPEADERALQQLHRIFTAEKDKLQLGNVGVLPVKYIEFEVPGLEAWGLGAKLVSALHKFAFTPDRKVLLQFEVPASASAIFWSSSARARVPGARSN